MTEAKPRKMSETQPDPAKVSALEGMKPPADTKELQTFLGLVTYIGGFIPNFGAQTAPLRELVKDEAGRLHTKMYLTR